MIDTYTYISVPVCIYTGLQCKIYTFCLSVKIFKSTSLVKENLKKCFLRSLEKFLIAPIPRLSR